MNALFRNSLIRIATLADIPFIMDIGKERYGDRAVGPSFDWVRYQMQNASAVVLVGPESVGISSIAWKYGSEKRARLDVLCARRTRTAPIEALQVLKAMIRWAAFNGAQGMFRVDADTGVDFGPFAKRLGGVEVDARRYPRYDIPLDGGAL